MGPIFTAIGNACTDLVAKVSDDFLQKHHIRKYFCTHFSSFDELQAVKSQMPDFQSLPGGAGANVAHVISALGGNAHFISKIGGDIEGKAFHDHMTSNGVTCHFPPIADPTRYSSQVLTLITPDGERTFASFDDVARSFSRDDYDFGLISQSAFLYLDGYSFCSSFTGDSFLEVIHTAQDAGHYAIFNTGDISIYETHTRDIDVILGLCDSVICNHDEACAFWGANQSPEQLAQYMSTRYGFGAITDGPNGAHVFSDNIVRHIPTEDLSDLQEIDTNGAGDHFAGGFLFGLMNGYDLHTAGRLGHLCAKNCLSHAGARPLGGAGSLKHLAEIVKT